GKATWAVEVTVEGPSLVRAGVVTVTTERTTAFSMLTGASVLRFTPVIVTWVPGCKLLAWVGGTVISYVTVSGGAGNGASVVAVVLASLVSLFLPVPVMRTTTRARASTA